MRPEDFSANAAGLRALMDEYYAARGYDLEWGWPTPELLQQLGLESAIAPLEALRASRRSI